MSEVLYQKEIVVTDVDIEILNAVCDGKIVKEIAAERRTSERTISGRIEYLKDKYDCHSAVQLVATFFRIGLLK